MEIGGGLEGDQVIEHSVRTLLAVNEEMRGKNGLRN